VVGQPAGVERVIVVRSPAEIERLARVNALVARVLAELRATVEPGISTATLDALAERLLADAGAEPAFKGYHGYPATICASVNEQVVHGIPSKRPLSGGDIVSIDMGAKLDGFYGDSAVTVAVGAIGADAARLLDVTEASLYKAIEAVKPGARVSDIGAAVQAYVEQHGFSVVREFVGHGIGTKLHEEPQIPNYGVAGRGPRLAEGMVLAIEPMVNFGKPAVKVLSDGWTAVTKDGSLSAHFEHTVVVTADGCRILTAVGEPGAAKAEPRTRAESDSVLGPALRSATP
jgi:methionyl aminopeptidase